MKKKRSLLCLLIMLTTLTFSVFVSAGGGSISQAEAWQHLKDSVTSGYYLGVGNNTPYGELNFKSTQYNVSGGGYKLYGEITSTEAEKDDIINETAFNSLTAKGKQDFLQDMLSIANSMVYDTESGTATTGVTNDTVTQLMNVLQTKSGMGSQLMATLLANTKPDYVTANRIYAPFSGPIGVALGLISILIMAMLGVTMALDIAYITLPMFQLVLDGDTDNGGQGGSGTKGMSRLVSAAARNAVKAENDGGNGQNGSGNKMALGVYFKYRWKSLVLLGICLLYLVQGQIYNFVAWILDLVSGTLGF